MGIRFLTSTEAGGATETYIDGVWYTNLTSFYVEKQTNYAFSATGSAQGWRADDATWLLGLPFAFPFYSKSYTQCWVDSNGRICLDGPTSSYKPTQGALISNATIAVLWDDIKTDGTAAPGEDIYVAQNSTQLIIRWRGQYYGTLSGVSCAVALYTNGIIRMQYGYGNTSGGMIGLSAGDGSNYIFSSRSQAGSMNASNDVVFPLSEPNRPSVALKIADLTDTNSFDVEASADPASQPWRTIYRFSSSRAIGFGYGYNAWFRSARTCGDAANSVFTNTYKFGYAFGYSGYGERPFLEWATSYTGTAARLFYRVLWK